MTLSALLKNKKMGVYTHGRMSERIKEVAAEFIQYESNTASLITVTRVTMSDAGTKTTIYVSVLPDDKAEEALSFLSRRRRVLGEKLGKDMNIRRIPRIFFALDTNEGLF